MALEQEIAAQTQAVGELTQEVVGKMGAIDAKVAQAEIDFNNLTPEKRIVTDIVIGGSSDFLYPVWWRFPEAGAGLTKLSISRDTTMDAATTHLLLEIEGVGYQWSAGIKFFQIKRFAEVGGNCCSHVRQIMFANAALSSHENAWLYSGCYLRGGAAYKFISNQQMILGYQDGSAGIAGESVLLNSPTTGHWTVTPIPIASIQTPIADLLPY